MAYNTSPIGYYSEFARLAALGQGEAAGTFNASKLGYLHEIARVLDAPANNGTRLGLLEAITTRIREMVGGTTGIYNTSELGYLQEIARLLEATGDNSLLAIVEALTATDGVIGESELIYNVSNTLDDVFETYVSGVFSALTDNGNFRSGISGTSSYWGGLRYRDVQIEQGATIASATLYTRKLGNPGGGTLFGFLRGVAADNCDLWATTHPHDAPLTAAGVAVVNGDHTYDIAAIIQEIVDRPGWAAGNAIGIVSEPTGADGVVTFLSLDTVGVAVHANPLTITLG